MVSGRGDLGRREFCDEKIGVDEWEEHQGGDGGSEKYGWSYGEGVP